MALGIDEIEELIAAAVEAEAWFTHQECIDPEKLDHEAYKVADKLRGALKAIEDNTPRLLAKAQTSGGLFEGNDNETIQ